MNFLEVIKQNYEENEHLHLLIKYNLFVVGLHINEQAYTLKFKKNHCAIMNDCTDETIPTIYLSEESIKDIYDGILLSQLISEKKVSYKGSLRHQLLMESLLYLSVVNYLKNEEAV